jgi:hypothetical protein
MIIIQNMKKKINKKLNILEIKINIIESYLIFKEDQN